MNKNSNDLFGYVKSSKLDKDSESFINLVRSIPEDTIRLIREDTWFSFGELQSRITVYRFNSSPLFFLCPSIIAHKILCIL